MCIREEWQHMLVKQGEILKFGLFTLGHREFARFIINRRVTPLVFCFLGS